MLPLPILNVRLQACAEDWQQMTPAARGRHCAQCDKLVVDLTKGTQADLVAARAAAGGRLCGRFSAAQLAPDQPAPLPVRGALRPKLRQFLVALVLVCGLGMSSGEAWAQAQQLAQQPVAPSAGPDSTQFVFGLYAEQMPVYQGGPDNASPQEKLRAFIRDNRVWPDSLRRITGKVFVDFVVDTVGNVREPQVQKGLHPQLDAEAIRVVRLLHFEPGRQNGRPVPVRYLVPVAFQPNAPLVQSRRRRGK